MEVIIFIGIQACGKSTFYKRQFVDTHIRINLDMLRTRNREKILFNACLDAKQPCVIDNTNVLLEERARYISLAKEHKFHVVGYHFRSNVAASLERNQSRPMHQVVPEKAILGTYRRLQLPQLTEGFDLLHYVTIDEANNFIVQEWKNEF